MKYYVNAVDAEISGVGKTKMLGDDIYVEDIIIFKQKCNGSHTDLDLADEARVMYERDKKGESSKDWNLWWHSHNTMDVFWSGTDEKNIADQANNGGYMLSIVTNKAGKFKTRFDIFPKDLSPKKVATYYKVEDDIDTIILKDEGTTDRLVNIQTKLDKLKEKKETLKKSIEEKYEGEIDEIEDMLFKYEYAVERLQESKEKLDKKIDQELEEKTKKTEEEEQQVETEYENLKSQELDDDDSLLKEIEKEVEEKVEVKSRIGFSYNQLDEYYDKNLKEKHMSNDVPSVYDDYEYEGYYDNREKTLFKKDSYMEDKLEDIRESALFENYYKY